MSLIIFIFYSLSVFKFRISNIYILPKQQILKKHSFIKITATSLKIIYTPAIKKKKRKEENQKADHGKYLILPVCGITSSKGDTSSSSKIVCLFWNSCAFSLVMYVCSILGAISYPTSGGQARFHVQMIHWALSSTISPASSSHIASLHLFVLLNLKFFKCFQERCAY